MKKLIIIVLGLTLAISLTACQATDVVGKGAVTSLEAVISNLPEPVSTDEVNNGWSLKSPGGERFVLSKDFSSEAKPDLMMEFKAKPFLDAGLDPNKLDKGTYLYDPNGDMLMVHSELGNDKFKNDSNTKPIDSFKEIVKTHRDNVKYHEKLDHYGMAFGGGNMFEWAKDIKTNDKDIVFVLNPKPFIDAGVDPTKVEGWIFTKVEIKNEQGNAELVDKFLKPYNLK